MFSVLAAAATPVTTPVKSATASATLNPALVQQLQQLQAQQGRSPLAVNAPWLTHTFAFIFIASAILLVIMLALQTTKQEGLSGTIGGRMESAYRGRLGGDAQMARVTTWIAVTFIIFGTLLSLTGI